MLATTLLPLVFTGLAIGSIYALIAFGFVLLLKATDTLCFAQLQFITLGAYFTFTVFVLYQLPFIIGVIVSALIGFLMGVLIYYLVIRPMTGQPHFSIVVATIGVGTMIKPVIGVIWGYSELHMPLPFNDVPISLGSGIAVSVVHLIILVITLLFIFIFILFFNNTLLGTQMRAVADDVEVAQMMGININRVYILSWGVAALSAAVGGIFLSGLATVNINLGEVAIKAFPVVILGGAQSIPGAIVGGLLIGVVEVLTGYFLGSQIRDTIVYLILILVLMIRPYGLFGEQKIERV